jgi:DNA-binding cell septation regulator SpoVG
MEIERMTKGSWGKIKAFFNVKVNGFTIKGFKLIEGMNGMFVGVPSIKEEDDTYDNTVLIDKDVMEDLKKTANKYYEAN